MNPDGKEVNAECIKKNLLPDYWNDELFFTIKLGIMYEKHGYPWGPSWADLPCHIYECIEIYLDCVDEWRAEMRKK